MGWLFVEILIVVQVLQIAVRLGCIQIVFVFFHWAAIFGLRYLILIIFLTLMLLELRSLVLNLANLILIEISVWLIRRFYGFDHHLIAIDFLFNLFAIFFDSIHSSYIFACIVINLLIL